MSENLGKLKAIWRSFEHKLSKEELETSARKAETLLGAIFCPGPFYYYLLDFSKLEIVYMHPSIETILGIKADGVSLVDFSLRIHPEDINHFLNCEKMASHFLFNEISIEKIPRYKISYCYRLLDINNVYRLFLHQAIAISVDQAGKIGKVLGVHADISHITMTNNQSISFIGLKGEKSYMGIPVTDGKLNLDQEEGPFTKRETEIIRLLAEGLSAQEIADALFLSYHTIRTHRQNILKRLDCRNTTQLITKCIRNGYI
ncbi:MAG: helix-turn-helix transcriptional regulator [Saprospiraceae bacterium]